MTTREGGVVGRERELAAVAESLADMRSLPCAILLEGEAGAGKTTLLEESLARGRERGYRVLACSPAGAEAEFSYSALADLLDGVVEDRLPALSGPQRHALGAALLLEEPEGDVDRRAVAVAFLNVLRSLAGERPLALAIDDVQWLDQESREVLGFAVRRLGESPVAFLLARRTVPPDSPPPLGLDRGLAPERVHTVQLGPLSLGALHHLVQARLGLVLPRPKLRRLQELSGGNPFYALELGRALERGSIRLEPGESLPGTLDALVGERLHALPAETREALTAAAALARPTTALVDASALEPAVESHVVEIAEAGVRFTHPLLRSAAYGLAPEQERRLLHRRLADMVTDVEERARHLALAADGPDEAVASELDRAARVVAARGAPEAAGELSELARSLTPADDLLHASRRTIDSGWYHFVAGDTDRARRLLEDAVAVAPEGPAKARALVRLAWLWHHTYDRKAAVRLYEIALEEAGEDRELRTVIHQGLAWSLSLMRGDMELVGRHAALAVAGWESLEDPAALADSLSVQAQSDFFRGGGLASPVMQRALDLGSGTGELRALNLPTMHWALMLACADRLEEARSHLAEVYEGATERGDETALPFILMRLSHTALLLGNWKVAGEHADRAYERAVQSGQRPLQADLLCTKALIEAHLGNEAAARAAAEEGFPLAREVGAGIGARLAPAALGLLQLSLGEAQGACDYLDPLWRESQAAGIVEPGENRYAGDLIEGLLALGQLERAKDVLEEILQRAKALDRPGALAVGYRSRGLLAAAEGDPAEGCEWVERAERAHERVPLPFEHARTLLALGQVRRRGKQKRAARESLEEALAAFESLGARLWAEQARSELARIGGRRPGTGGLTETERQLAELVAEGRSNKEVAAALFVTAKTVETRLSRMYAKLGIHSRGELTRRVLERKL